MTYVFRNGSVFLHTPKTGGTILGFLFRDLRIGERTFDNSGRSHYTSEEIRNILPFTKIMCFVRFPTAWLASLYSHFERRQRGIDETLCIWESLKRDSFEDFLNDYLDNYPGLVGKTFEQYTKGASFVGRYENMHSDVFLGLKELGVKLKANQLLGLKKGLMYRANYAGQEHKQKTRIDAEFFYRVCIAESKFISTYYNLPDILMQNVSLERMYVRQGKNWH